MNITDLRAPVPEADGPIKDVYDDTYKRLLPKIEAKILRYILHGYSTKQMKIDGPRVEQREGGGMTMIVNVTVDGPPMNARAMK